jgi:Holliday junction resolvase
VTRTALAIPPPERPANRNYARGADFERAVASCLHSDGYETFRIAGSHGSADVIAIKPGQILVIQCKLTGPGGVSPREWNGLLEMARRVHAVPLVAHRPVRGRIEYLRITGPKDRPTRRPPAEPWTADETNGE